MKYNFDEKIDCLETCTTKWGKTEEIFGEKDILPLWVAEMDFKLPKEVSEKLQAKAADGVFGYLRPPKSLFESVARWTKDVHDWEINDSEILHTTGVVPAISAAIQAFTEKGDKIVIQPPVYTPFFKVIETQEREIVTNPLIYENGKYRMDFEDLERKIVDHDAKMFIFCSPHNPVGRVWTEEELSQLADICIKHDVLILSDEIHYDLVFKNSRHIPLITVKKELEDRVITTIAASKTFNIAGLNTAFAVVPNEELRKKLEAKLAEMHQSSANPFSVVAVEAVYEHGKEWLEQCIDYVEENAKFLAEFVKERIPEVSLVEPEGTYLAWLDFRRLGMDGDDLFQFMLKEAKVALNSGKEYGAEGEGFLRINIACRKETLVEALERIEKAIKNIK